MPRLKLATTDNETVKPTWRPKKRQALSALLIAATLGLGLAFWIDPTLGGHTTLAGFIFAACILMIGQRQPPERQPDQVRPDHGYYY